MLTKSSSTEWIPLFVVLACWGFVSWFSWFRYEPVPVVAASAAEDVFSAERAEEFLNRLFVNTEPHPAGKNADFRNRVVKEFQALGYDVEHQRSVTNETNYRYEGPKPLALTNLIARHAGPDDDSTRGDDATPIILAGHFDSHPVSPGVADDGVSIAVCLEIARMLRDRPIPGLMFVLTDGEEFGALGARDLVEKNSFPIKPIVINIEARGTSGPSLMFETSNDSRWLVDLFAKSSRKPFASSLFFEIYRLLPNETDFTVYKDAGWRGLNFAFIGDVRNYHTPGDNLESLDRRSLQHHGENVWNVVKELSVTDIASVPQNSAVYFDMFGLCIIRWPGSWSMWLALAATGLGIVVFSGVSPPSASRVASAFFGLVCLFSVMVVSLVTGWLVQKGLALDGALDDLFPKNALAVELTFWLWPLVAMVFVAWVLSGRTELCSVLSIVWGMWSALAIVTSQFVPGCSYLFIAPLVLMVGVLMLLRWTVARNKPERFAMIAATSGAIAAGLLWLPMERLFYDALGFSLNIVLFVRVMLVLTTLLPVIFLLSRPRQMILLASTTACVVVVTVSAVWFN